MPYPDNYSSRTAPDGYCDEKESRAASIRSRRSARRSRRLTIPNQFTRGSVL